MESVGTDAVAPENLIKNLAAQMGFGRGENWPCQTQDVLREGLFIRYSQAGFP